LAGGSKIDAKQYAQKLQAIGHLVDPSRMQPVLNENQPQVASTPLPPAQWGAYAYYNNLGVQMQKEKKLREATEAFQAAIDRNPSNPSPYMNMALTLFERQQYTAADDAFRNRGAQTAACRAEIHRLRGAYRSRNMTSRAIAPCTRKQTFPQSYLIAEPGRRYSGRRYTEGIAEMERALSPALVNARPQQHRHPSRQEERIRPCARRNRSLSIDPRQPRIRQAIETRTTHL
jgi:tetratricopeptide (TPR) repeat protein